MGLSLLHLLPTRHSSPPGTDGLFNPGFPLALAWSLLCSDTVLLFAC